MLHEIVKDPNLSKDDLFSLRTVCKNISAYATEAFFEQRFRNGIELDVASIDFACLAGICSSRVRPFIKSIHFQHLRGAPSIQLNRNICPDYSSIRDIKFEAHIEKLVSARALKKVLQRTKHLGTFMLNLGKPKSGTCWCSREWSYRVIRDRKPVAIVKHEEREKVDTILSGIKSDYLAELVITSSFMSYQIIKSLLERHRGIIRKMTLRSCQMIGGSWIDLLLWISNNLPSLEHIELYRLQEMKWQRAFDIHNSVGKLFYSPVTITGKTDIETYLRSLGKSDTTS